MGIKVPKKNNYFILPYEPVGTNSPVNLPIYGAVEGYNIINSNYIDNIGIYLIFISSIPYLPKVNMV